MPIDESRTFRPVNIAVLTVSDTRGLAEDRSGDTLVARLTAAGHVLADRAIERDDVDTIVARLRGWITSAEIDVIVTTGGTGVTGRDEQTSLCEQQHSSDPHTRDEQQTMGRASGDRHDAQVLPRDRGGK